MDTVADWVIVHTFRQGNAMAEISRAGDTARFSFRLTWCEVGRQGPWFPATGISFLDDIAAVTEQAESWILAQKDLLTAQREARLASTRERDNDKRRSLQAAQRRRGR